MAVSKPLISHCKRGHLYDAMNTRMQQGKRVCRKCVALRALERYHRLGLNALRDKERTREQWRAYYHRDPQKHIDRHTRERLTLSDNYIISLIADEDPSLRNAARKHPAVIELVRAQVTLNRAINERSK